MPYPKRNRAVRPRLNVGKLKLARPAAKFTLSKQYVVSQLAPAADKASALVLQINAATPWYPLTVKTGDWSPLDNNESPFGITSDVYSHYKHLVVLGCNVRATVRDAPDEDAPTDQWLSTGQLSLIRSSDNGQITGTTDAADIRNMYGAKSMQFQLSPRGSTTAEGGAPSNVLTKNAIVSQGYSAKKQHGATAYAIDDLKVVNDPTAAIPSDSTFINVAILPRDPGASDYLLPVACTVRITYIVGFTDPTQNQSVPLPLGLTGGQRRRMRRAQAKPYTQQQAYNDWNMLRAVMGQAGLLGGGLGIAARANRFMGYGARRAIRG